MKRISLSFLLALLMSMAANVAMAYDVEIDGIYYNLSRTEATVTYKNNNYNSYSGSVTIPESVSYNGRTYRVTTIGGCAFEDCNRLISVTIPNCVNNIEYRAFEGCVALHSVSIPDNVTNIGKGTFKGCSSLTSINIPEGVTIIAWETFNGCSSLTSISIPEGVTSIESNAFEGCLGLRAVTIPNNVTSIGYEAFKGCLWLSTIDIPEGVTEIGRYAFDGTAWYNNQPDGLVYAGKVAYRYKGTMPENTTINIKDGTVSISEYAFDGCTNLTDITIPESATSIGRYAFNGTGWYNNQPDGLVYASKVAYRYKGTMPENTTIGIKEGTLGISDYAFSSCSGLKSITIPEGVKSIGKFAFQACRGLTSIIIPESVTSIGEGAFSSCEKLTSITIPQGVKSIEWYTFDNCYQLSTITIPEGVTSIGNAFSSCHRLQSITIPKSVTTIAERTFTSCENIKSIIVKEGNPAYDSRGDCNALIETASNTLLVGCINTTIPNGVTTIGSAAFSNRYGLTSISIPESVTSISESAFYGCSGLTSIVVEDGNTVYDSRGDCNALIETDSNALIIGCCNSIIPDGVISIKSNAFIYCSKLTSITIPNSVTSIGSTAFESCIGLTSITIPNSVTSIGASAFAGCTHLTSITIHESVTDIGSGAFTSTAWYDNQPDGLVYAGKVAYKYKGTMPENIALDIIDGTLGITGNAFWGCTNLTSITIPESVTCIGSYAFYGCSGLTSINIPEGVKVIDYGTFSGCSSLSSITIGNNVTRIGSYAFNGCMGLSSIVIPESVTSIGSSAFSGCSGLTSIKIPEGVTSIFDTAFSGCSGLTSIVIPESVTEIGRRAFYTQSSDVSLKVGMKTPINIREDTFLFYGNSTLYVPKGSKSAYWAYPWSRIGNIVESNYVDAEDLSIAAGNSTMVEIDVNNFEQNLVGFQMDLTLPEGVCIDKTGCSLSSRITDEEQELTIGKLEDGTYRLTSTSLSLTPISGHDGTLLTLKLTTEDGCEGGQATISNILFSTSDSEKIIMDDETFDISILYILTYKVDGEVYKTSSIAYGTSLTPEANPTKEGYTFSGWSEIPATMPNHDVEVKGSFSINSYTLTYMLDGEVYKTESVVYGTPLEEEPAPAKEGYTFSGWSELPETMPAMDVVITGSFTVNSYSLTYIVDDEVYKVLDVDYGTTIVPEPAPHNDGHTFSGWRGLPATMPANDVVVMGIFSYTLTYKVDGEEYKIFSVFYGTELTLEAEPTKDGYTFGGWSELPTTMPNHDVEIIGNFYLYGDVNTDEDVDVVDVVDIARYVVATPSVKFREKLADLNFDYTVNIADAVTLVNYIAGDQNFVKAWAAPSNFTANDALSLTEKNGNLSLSLENERNYTAFQFDLFVPKDIDVTAMMLNTGRNHGHQLLYNKVEDGHYRVAALSISNNNFKGNESELLKIALNEVYGNEVSIRDIHFFDAKGNDYLFDDIEGAIATSLSPAFSQSEEDIYDLQGRKRGKLQRGVNIVGGKKIMVKK